MADREQGAGRPGQHLTVEVVTPAGAILGAAPADEVTAPGQLGELGLLPGHVPLLTALRAGVLSLRVGQAVEMLAIGPGFLQVGAGDQVRILSQMAKRPEEVDADAARQDRDHAEADLGKGLAQGAELDALRATLEWAQAQLAVLAAAPK